MNVPYLWGGRAGFGLDCSGFTSTIYQVYGITLPRDAGPQATDSQSPRSTSPRCSPGDLLFYSHDSTDPDNPDAIYCRQLVDHAGSEESRGSGNGNLDANSPTHLFDRVTVDGVLLRRSPKLTGWGDFCCGRQ